jgi:hypothetical protein
MHTEFESFKAFWPYYLSEHNKPATRLFHFLGTGSLLPLSIIAIVYNPYIVFLYPLCAYGLAWFSHLAIEKNTPTTFKQPIKSLMADFKMFWYMLTGRMKGELQRHQNLKE